MPRLQAASSSILRSCTCQSQAPRRFLNTLVPALPELPYKPTSSSAPQEAPADYDALKEGLARFDPKYDVHPEKNWRTGPNSMHEIFLINEDPPMSRTASGAIENNSPSSTAPDQAVMNALANSTQFTLNELRDFHKYPLVIHRVASMTDKGKQLSMYALVVAGDGNGLLGVGEGKHENVAQAIDKAFNQAVKNMGVVERFEDRTVWGDRKDKYCATKIEMWSRPPGFGLRTSPMIHQVAKAAGITDLAAKIRGSKNQMNTVKLAVRMLQNRSSPLGMGNIQGRKGSRDQKGQGMRTAQEIAFSLGRRAVEI